jgi:hypothetical protein
VINRIVLVVGFAHAAIPSLIACSCVSAVATTPRSEVTNAELVFRGTVLESKRLPQHSDSNVRQRYAVTFRVNRLWKGTPNETATLYDLSPGTDCQGFGFEVGKEYLVYASQAVAEDFKIGERLFYAWTDILTPGTQMLRPIPCTYGGLTSDKGVKNSLSGLGPGKAPARK